MTPTLETTLFIAVVGIAGIFIFMMLFYLMIVGLDKYLPHQEDKPAASISEEAGQEEEEEEEG